MTVEEQIQTIKDGYAGFGRGEAEAVIALFTEDVDYYIPGSSSISGTFKGRADVLGMWGRLDPSFKTELQFAASDGENRVVAVTHDSQAGDSWTAASVFTFTGDLISQYDGITQTAMLEKHYPA